MKIEPKDDTPIWAYDEDGYCVCCGNGYWKYHILECELRDALDVARCRDEMLKELSKFMHKLSR